MDMELIQGSNEWLAVRRRHITSSDAAVICGANPWRSQYSLWREKLNLGPKEEENEAMRKGKELEPIAREWFIDATSIDMRPKVEFQGIFMASLDGYSAKDKSLLEIKCGKKAFDQASQGVIPDYYKCQIQHQLLTCGIDRAFYLAFWEGAGIVMDVYRNEEFIEDYIPKAEEFYRRMIDFDPPEAEDKDYIDMGFDDEYKRVSNIYKHADEMCKYYGDAKEEAKKTLVSLSNNQNAIGNGVRVSKIVRQGSVEYGKIPELKTLDLNQYRKKPTEYWSIHVER